MLLRRAELERIAAGPSVVYRRWRRPTVKAGGTLRTVIGVLAIDSLEAVDPEAITDAEAGEAGHPSLAALMQALDKCDGVVYRIRLRRVGADPRGALRAADRLEPVEREAVRARLARLDTRSAAGPWTRDTLALIASRPGRRAGELAAALGLEKPAFKRNVRKLKELGLTESLDVGYRLSPRGAVVLALLGGAPD